MTIPDRLPQQGILIAGGRWEFQTMGLGATRTIWVQGLHWPGCDDAHGHDIVGFGVQRVDKFLQFNTSFWDNVALDYTLVRDVARRMQVGVDSHVGL